MKTIARQHNSLYDFIRLIRVEDYGTFIQLVIGYIISDGEDFRFLAITLIIMTVLIYGGLYALNDARDVQADRSHPLKRERPVAAGRIDARSAVLIGVSLIAGGVLTAFSFDLKVFILALIFLGINLAYTFALKQVPYLEIVLNTITHPLRFVAGMWLAGNWEHWHLIFAWIPATLAITTLKRLKEMRESSMAVRPVLKYYRESTLKAIMFVCIGGLLTLMPFTRRLDLVLTGIWFVLTCVAVVGFFYIPAIKRLEEYFWR